MFELQKVSNIKVSGPGTRISRTPTGTAISIRNKAAARDTGHVMIKNNSGADRNKFEVLGVDGAVYDTTTELDEYKATVTVKGIEPDEDIHGDLFVILQADILDGNTGKGLMVGTTPVQINITDTGHEYAVITDTDYTMLTSSNAMTNCQIIAQPGSTGTQWCYVRMGKPINDMFIAEVDSDATGGGYYNCHLQTLDATDWNTDTADQLDDVGDSVVVLNLAEMGEDVHNLDVGGLIICHKFIDDEGNVRYVGSGVESGGGGVHVQTQEALQTDGTVSVKRLNSSGSEIGDAFDVYALMTKGATASPTTAWWPTISNDQKLIVSQNLAGEWYVIKPDIQSATECD